jgi:hypothetical protein
VRALSLFVCIGIGCSNSNPVSVSPGVSQAIGPGGGSLTVDGVNGVSVPPGALAATTTITMAPFDGPALPADALPHTAFLLGPEGQPFQSAVTVALAIPGGQAEVVMETAPRGGGTFTPLATAASGGVANAATLHFSIFVLVPAPPSMPDLSMTPAPDFAVTPLPDLAVAPPDLSAQDLTAGCGTNPGDIANCGGIGLACSVANAQPACVGGQCVICSCKSGYADCNAMPVDGCETNVASDPNNCGGCAYPCPSGMTRCVGGRCAP